MLNCNTIRDVDIFYSGTFMLRNAAQNLSILWVNLQSTEDSLAYGHQAKRNCNTIRAVDIFYSTSRLLHA